MSNFEYKRFWKSLDKNGDNSLTFKEFCKIVSPGNAMPDAKVRRVANHIMKKYGSVGRALQAFDRNHNGIVRCRGRRLWVCVLVGAPALLRHLCIPRFCFLRYTSVPYFPASLQPRLWSYAL